MRSELQTVLDSLPTIHREQLPELLGELEVIRAAAMLRLSTVGAGPATHDELLGIEAAAERLGVSTDYLYRNSKTLPFTRRMGRKLLFSSVGIDAYLKKKER
jgi:excisionase family DNA binding protein